MVRYHYVDVLLSHKDAQFYAGSTQNGLKRLELHNSEMFIHKGKGQ